MGKIKLNPRTVSKIVEDTVSVSVLIGHSVPTCKAVSIGTVHIIHFLLLKFSLKKYFEQCSGSSVGGGAREIYSVVFASGNKDNKRFSVH